MPTVPVDANTNLFYIINDFTDPWGESDIVLLHHSAARSVQHWYAWVPRLARYFKVLRFDMRGHGQSTIPPRDYQWDVRTLARDVDHLLGELGISQVHYIGASAGGTIGQQFAVDYPERLKSLVLLSARPGMVHWDSNGKDWLDTVKSKGHKGMNWGKMLQDQAYLRFNVDEMDPRQIAWSVTEAAKTSEWILAGLVGCFAQLDLLPVLSKITAPTLIIGGERSPSAPPRTLELMRDTIPNAELSIMRGQGHSFYSAVPDACLDLIFNFYRRLGVPLPERA
jgi:pimeloyl-ACP methyl ester carboxylesterase